MSALTMPRPGTPFPHAESISHSHASNSSLSYFDMPSTSSTTAASSSSSSSRRYSQPLHFTLQSIPSRTPPSLLKRSASSASSTSTNASTSQVEHIENIHKHKSARSLSPIPSPRLSAPASASTSTSTPGTPPFIARRESSSSSCTLSPPMPATPRQDRPERPILAHGLSDFPELDEFRLSAPVGEASSVGVIELLEDEAYDLARFQAEEFYRKPRTPFSTPAPVSSSPAHANANANSSTRRQRQFDPMFYASTAQPRLERSPLTPIAQIAQPKPRLASTLTHRPKLKRRDTPRPVQTFTSIALSSLGSWYGASSSVITESEDEAPVREQQQRQEGVRRYRSMVDGGEWMVLA